MVIKDAQCDFCLPEFVRTVQTNLIYHVQRLDIVEKITYCCGLHVVEKIIYHLYYCHIECSLCVCEIHLCFIFVGDLLFGTSILCSVVELIFIFKI